MLSLTPLSAGFGVQAEGVDLRTLSDEGWPELERAFYDGQVLAIRAQELTPALIELATAAAEDYLGSQ